MNGRQPVNPVWLAPGDVIVTTLARPALLPPGTQGRRASCAICGDAIGPAAADQVVLWPAEGPVCDCGRTEVVAFLMHASHPLPEANALIELVRDRMLAHHGHGEVLS